MLVSPMPTYAIILGHVAGGVLRGLIVGFIVTLIALFFTKLKVANALITLSVIILTAVVFALAGLINAILARKFDDISIIPSFVLAPLTYLGGVFYSITLLPEFAQKLSLLNPILYMVNAFRYGMLGVSDIDIGRAYAIIFVFIAVLFGASMILMKKGIGIRE
jgi:ABC-2 type transport system permease protein